MSKINEKMFIELYNAGKDDIELAELFQISERTVQRLSAQLRKKNKIKYRAEFPSSKSITIQPADQVAELPKIDWKIPKSKITATNKKPFTSYLVVADTHIPYINQVAMKSVLRLMDDITFDGFVMLGDYMDMEPISHWLQDKRQNKTLEGKRMQADYIEGNKLLDEFDKRLPKNCDKRYFYGNHERFYYDLIEKMPALAGFFEPKIELNLADRGYTVYDKINHVEKIGRLAFTHGMYHSMNYVKAHLDKFATNVIHADMHCVDEDTEILTEDGWKVLREISVNDLVATYNLNKRQVEYQPILNINKYDYEGEMIHINRAKNNPLDQLMTPNHRNILVNNRGYNKVKFAGQLIANDHLLLNTKTWKYPIKDILPNQNWAELIGFIIGDGYYEHSKNDTLTISISQKNTKVKERYLLNLLNKCQIRYNKCKFKKNGTFRCRISTKYNKQFINWMKNNCPNKKLTRDLISLPLVQLKLLYKGLMKSDGHKRTKTCSIFTQKDINNVRLFEELCLKLGKRFVTRKNISGTNSEYYYISVVSSRNKSSAKLTTKDIRKKMFKGLVWCPETHNGTWIAKRGGQAFITGNSPRFRCAETIARELAFVGYCLGCLCDLNPNYMRNRPNKWSHGFGVVYFYDNGYFDVDLKRIVKGRFVFNNKLYDGNK